MGTVNCADQRVVELYRHMQADGFKGATLSCAEIIDAALEAPERYHEYLQVIAGGRPVPWLLDDFDDATSFDLHVREKVDAAIQFVKKELTRQGMSPHDFEYQRRLAVALYIFCQWSSSPHVRFSIPFATFRRMDPFDNMEQWGFLPFEQYLETHGGLGLRDFPADAPIEATALEALEQRRGICTERSKDIYAVLRRAGLTPFFIYMTAEHFKQAWGARTGETVPVATEDYLQGHIATGLSIGGKVLYFEPNEVSYGVDFSPFLERLSPREMYQLDLSNLIGSYSGNSQFDHSEQFINGALALGPSPRTASIYNQWGALYRRKGEREKAISALQTALEANPQDEPVRTNLCLFLRESGQLDAAVQCLNVLPADAPKVLVERAEIARLRGDFQAERILWEKALALGVDPTLCHTHLARILLYLGSPSEAEKHARNVVTLHPGHIEALGILGDALFVQGKYQEAVDIFQQSLALSSNAPALVLRMSETLVHLKRRHEAEVYLRRFAAAMADEQRLTYDVYERWVAVAIVLHIWEPFEKVAFHLTQEKFNNAVSGGLMLVDVQSHLPRPESRQLARRNFAALLTKTYEVGAHLQEPTLYWHFARQAEAMKEWKSLLEFCEATNDLRYLVYSLHGAWKSGDQRLVRGSLKKWDDFFTSVESIGIADRDLEKLGAMAMAVRELPTTMVKAKEYRQRCLRLYALYAETLEASGKTDEAARIRQQEKNL